MSGFERIRAKKIAAGVMATMMLVIVLLSAAFIAAESDHDCCGDDCPICACLELCENNICHISGGAVQAAIIVPIVFICYISFFFVSYIYRRETPVSRKVRLNN